MDRTSRPYVERRYLGCEVAEKLHSLRAAHAFVLLTLCWTGLMVAACAEGGESEGKVAARTVDAKSSGSVTFDTTALGFKAALEIKVKPLAVKQGDDLLLRIELIEAEAGKPKAADAPRLAVGTVAFFPPARIGEERTFVVPLDKGTRAAARSASLTAIVSVLPANPARSIDDARLEIVSARLR